MTSSASASLLSNKVKPWKRRGNEKDVIAGPSYEDVDIREGRRSMMDIRQEQESKKRDTMVFLGRSENHSTPSSPSSTWGRGQVPPFAPGRHVDDRRHGPAETATAKEERAVKVSSGEFRQEGGILGRLGFEDDSVPKSRESLWIDTTPRRPSVDQAPTMYLQEPAHVTEPLTSEAAPEERSNRTSEEVEILESVEKKQKFWKRPRRLSKAFSDAEDELQVSRR